MVSIAALIAANRVSRKSRLDLRNLSRRCFQVEAELDSGLKQKLHQGKSIFNKKNIFDNLQIKGLPIFLL